MPEFQTLIGTVKRGRTRTTTPRSSTFQTLIGTVKSLASITSPHLLVVVSNPHRYGQKLISQAAFAGAVEVSNPHRYGQKP